MITAWLKLNLEDFLILYLITYRVIESVYRLMYNKTGEDALNADIAIYHGFACFRLYNDIISKKCQLASMSSNMKLMCDLHLVCWRAIERSVQAEIRNPFERARILTGYNLRKVSHRSHISLFAIREPSWFMVRTDYLSPNIFVRIKKNLFIMPRWKRKRETSKLI